MGTLSTSLLKVAGLAIIALALTVFLACGSSSDAGDSDAAIGDSAVAADDDHDAVAADDDHDADAADDDHDADATDDDHDADAADDDHDADAADDDHDADDEVLINISTENMKFVPDTITIKVGQTIRLHMENSDPILHDYTTDEAEFIVLESSGAVHTDHDDEMDMDGDTDSDAQVSLQPLHIAAEANDHGDLVFQATEAGEYSFYCSVPGHLEAGMVGTIIIEE